MIFSNKQSENQVEQSNEKKIVYKVSTVSIVVNLLLSLMKLVAGLIAHSGAMVSDAIHSASDVFSTFIVIIGVTISEKEADDNHQYGHERFECVASIFLAVVLAITGIGIGIAGVEKIMAGNYEELEIPGLLALIAAIVSILVKEWMFWYTRAAAKKINSGALMADAWHHRSDALSSIGAFIGILGARLGFPVLEPVASVVICLFIGKAAFDIIKDALDKLVDKACPDEMVGEIRDIINDVPGVVKIDDLKTRLFGAKVYVDVEIGVNGDVSLHDAHEIAIEVHDAIEAKIENVKHCMVHENPV